MIDLLLDPVTLTSSLTLLILCAAVFTLRRLMRAEPGGKAAPTGLFVGLLIPLCIMQLAFLILAATPAVVNRLLHYTENLVPYDAACIEEGSPLVVLSGGVSSSVKSAEDLGSVYEATFVRMAAAIALINRQSAIDFPVYLAGGIERRGVAESDVMQHFFELTGVPTRRIILERISSNTAESAFEVAKLATAGGGKQPGKIRLLTSALHMARANAVFISQGFDVCPVHVDRKAIRNVSWWWLLPQLSPLKKFDTLLHEWVGIIFYKFKGYL